jgi:hypothetical protein
MSQRPINSHDFMPRCAKGLNGGGGLDREVRPELENTGQ